MELLQEVDPPSMVDDTQPLMYDEEATDDDDDDGLLLTTEEEYTVEDAFVLEVKADSVSTEHVSDNDIDTDCCLLLV